MGQRAVASDERTAVGGATPPLYGCSSSCQSGGRVGTTEIWVLAAALVTSLLLLWVTTTLNRGFHEKEAGPLFWA